MAIMNDTRNITDKETEAEPWYYLHSKSDYQRFHDIFFAIFITVAFFSFLLNILVFTTYVFMKNSLKTRKSNLLLCLQSCIDLIVSLSTSFYGYYISTFLGVAEYRAMEPPIYFVIDFVFKYSQLLAITSLFVFTCERFIAISFPLFHRSRVTATKILIGLFCSSLLSAIPSSIFVYYGSIDYKRVVGFLDTYFIATTTIKLLLILSVFILLGIAYRRIRQSLGGSSGKSNISTRSESKQRRDEEKQKRILIIFIAMCSIYTFTFLPLTIWNRITPIILSREIIEFYPANIVNFTFILMYHLSALINPLITMCLIKDYKKMFSGFVLKRFYNKNQSHSTSSLATQQSTSV